MQSSRALFSSMARFARDFLMALQCEFELLTCLTVWFKVAAMICGRDLEVRSGKEERVETQSSG